jgi:hypothetical protein
LGSNTDGRDDVVVEINPRLTTSYVGLRAAAAADANLAAAILAVCQGRTPRLSFLPIEVEYEPNGYCHLPTAFRHRLAAAGRTDAP